MNTNKDWPISPTFLSLRQWRSEEHASYNQDGIYYPDYIRGFLADLSHDKRVQNALTLFQFVPDDFLPNDSNADIATESDTGTVLFNNSVDERIKPILKGRKIIRIDSGTFINNGRRCDCFRKCKPENTDFCFRQDSIVGIFADEKLGTLDPMSKKYRKKLNRIIASFNKGRDKISKIRNGRLKIGRGKRQYIHYTCPKSLYEEHIFPIYVQEHIIACLVLGQMARESFGEEKTFSDDIKEMKEYEKKKNIAEIEAGEKNKGEYRSVFEYKIPILSQEDWDEKARAIFNRIQTFETRLEERIEHQNIRYINDEFEKIEDQFRKKVKEINIKKQDTFKKFSAALNGAFATIRKKFDNSPDGFIRMFALPVDIEHRELIPIGWTGRELTEMKDFKFSLEELRGIDLISKREQIERIKEAASQKIKELYNEEHDVLLPGWLAGDEVAYIVWKRHSHELRDSITQKIFDIYRKSLRNFYSIALECYSYIRGARMELLLETTIQESAHESAHFILPSIDVVEKHLKIIPTRMISPSYEEDYSKYKDEYDKYREEVLESLIQLNSINSGSSLIFSPVLKIHKESTQVFYLLYKLKKVLDVRASDSHKYIQYQQNEDGVRANIDVTYFNHALYNLLDNAIKYGHEGSYIYIYMDVNRKTDCLNVRVVSYGIGILQEEQQLIYNLFGRGSDASHISRGRGLGMYIVKKVCEAHGGKISHTSEKLSDYNIPVLLNYKNIIKKLSLEEVITIEKELSWLSAIQHEVVYDRNFVKYEYVFRNRVKTPTYRNTFYVTIPLK